MKILRATLGICACTCATQKEKRSIPARWDSYRISSLVYLDALGALVNRLQWRFAREGRSLANGALRSISSLAVHSRDGTTEMGDFIKFHYNGSAHTRLSTSLALLVSRNSWPTAEQLFHRGPSGTNRRHACVRRRGRHALPVAWRILLDAALLELCSEPMRDRHSAAQ